MDIEEAKKMWKTLELNKEYIKGFDKEMFFEFGETVLNELEKKDKVINEMAEEIASYNRYEAGALDEKEEVINFFTNKAENVGEEGEV